MRQHCTDGSFRFCRWRAHREALSEDSGPEALSTHGQSFALQVFSEILKHIAGELSANCCRTLTMTRYNKATFAYESCLGGSTVGTTRGGLPGKLSGTSPAPDQHHHDQHRAVSEIHLSE